MKKILAPLLVLALSFLLSAPAEAASAKPAPTKQDILVMKHNLLTLWKMGIKSSQPMGEAELMASTLVFLLQGELEESVEEISTNPDRFTNLPPDYSLFVLRQKAENTAFLVFNGFVGQNLPSGVFLGAEGYYINPIALVQSHAAMEGEGYLPAYCTIESQMQQADGTLILNGRMRRFQQNSDTGQEILWASAPFMARFVPTERGWQLVSFIFTEEAMG